MKTRSTSPLQPEPPYREHPIQLSDGRMLGIAEFGNPQGPPLFWFHGTPGARRQVPPAARDIAARRGLRIVGVERPGIGASTAHRYAGMSDFASDLAEVADQLDIGRFGLLGLSGGGPYVLACAHRLRERVVAAAVFGGVAPAAGEESATGGAVRMAVPFHDLIRLLREPLAASLALLVRSLYPIKDVAFPLILRLIMAENDRAILLEPRMRAVFIDDILEGSRTGMRALLYDALLFGRPWDFSLAEVRVPVHFFQGDEDALVPLSHGIHMASLLPGARFTRMPGAGHLGALDGIGEAIEFVLRHWNRSRRGPRKRSV